MEMKSKAYWEVIEAALKDTDRAVPQPVMEPIRRAAGDMKAEMESYEKTERETVRIPETWERYEKQHQEITGNLQKLSDTYNNQANEGEKKAAAENAETAFRDGETLFSSMREILEQNQKLQEEVAALRKQMDDISRTIAQTSHDKELWEQCQQAYAAFVGAAAMKYWRKSQEPSKAALLYREGRKAVAAARNQIGKVSQDIAQTPQRVREDIRNKTNQIIDRSLERIAGVFNKGIAYLEKRRDAILQLSPREAEKLRRKEPTMDRPGDKKVKKVVARRSPARGKEQGR